MDLLPMVFEAYDYVYGRVRGRAARLADDEYRWEPVPDMWTVRERTGRWLPDGSRPAPEPAPVTTIAWRLWHIADCLASYVSPHLGEWPLPVAEGEWYGDAASALAGLDVANEAFRARITALGEDGIAGKLGPAWGPYAESSWADLVLHALDEVAHHGAEVGLLRDLYLRQAVLGPARSDRE